MLLAKEQALRSRLDTANVQARNQKQRQALHTAGLRPIQIGMLKTRRCGFAGECRHPCLLVAQADSANGAVGAATTCSGDSDQRDQPAAAGLRTTTTTRVMRVMGTAKPIMTAEKVPSASCAWAAKMR